MKRKWRKLSLYQKFALVITVVGLFPMVILTTFVAEKMIDDYRKAMHYQYQQAAGYVSSSLESILESYNTISKLPYYYNFSGDEGIWYNAFSFDNFRKIVYGERYEPETMEEERERDMENFLQYIHTVDSSICATHFVGRDLNGKKISFHYSNYSTYFKDETLFEENMGYENWDCETKEMVLVLPHKAKYFNNLEEDVFTIARNYFDLRGEVSHQPYVGTIFIDIRLSRIEKLFWSMEFDQEERFYVINEKGDCFYSNEENCIGTNMKEYIGSLKDTQEQLIIKTKPNEFGVQIVVVLDTVKAFRNIREIQNTMYFILLLSFVVLLGGSIYFSRRLTKPIHKMMHQMSQIENGNFDIRLEIDTEDEIGVLAERFNEMSQTLKQYINQSYLSKIRQNEAELTALKSQIYPHFLYNTLEIIRMTALDNEESKVAEMIEALSEQIHYLIGPMQDVVPVEKEIDIVKKYVYLLNCRIAGKIQLIVNAPKKSEIFVPKVILQPIVENAYVHGIKPKMGSGNIMIEVERKGNNIEISVLDNGVGMNEKELEKIQVLLNGDEPGIKNEYNWQSIGLKNVHDRIRCLYGDAYGIEVTSTPGMGTCVHIVMPFQKEEGTGKDENDISG